jgi:RNA polymerase sigma-70 factor (ECF subfamily)
MTAADLREYKTKGWSPPRSDLGTAQRGAQPDSVVNGDGADAATGGKDGTVSGAAGEKTVTASCSSELHRDGRAWQMVTHRDGPAVGCEQLSDADLIERSLSQPDWFSGIFDRHADEIMRYMHARLGPVGAEDAVAETFLAAFRHRARYDRARADVRPWLYGIATRVIGKHRRAERRRQRMLQHAYAEGTAAAHWAADDMADRCAERVTAGQLGPRIAAVVSALPRRDRDLLLLIAWAELTYGEAAQALGIPVGTVRSRLSRIRAKTRAALGGTNPLHSRETDHG